MTAAAEILAAAARQGLRVCLADGRLVADVPQPAPPSAADLLAQLRAHRAEVLAMLQRRAEVPDGPCPACGGRYWWRLAEGDGWTCGRCHPDPRAARWRGVTLATLGDRGIVLRAPAGDLPAIGEWCRLPSGAVGDLLAYTPDGSEALLRLFSPPGQPEFDPPRFIWVEAGRLTGEADWCGCGRRA